MRGTSLAPALAGCALLAGALTAGAATAAPPAAGAIYVAMGSSYAAGPGVGAPAEAAPAGCSQSRDNYPRQVARALKLQLVDRSCSGATTVHILRGGQFGLPAQLDGLSPDTRLVTVTIGGNDVRYTADLGLTSCRARPPQGRACPEPPAFDEEAAFATLAENFRNIVAEVRRRSPQARLVFVDYVTVLPASGTCAATPMAAADADKLRARAARLAALTARVAMEGGADLIKGSEITRGHDACSSEPWMEGYVQRARPTDWGPVAYHPTLPSATAVAQAVVQRLQGEP